MAQDASRARERVLFRTIYLVVLFVAAALLLSGTVYVAVVFALHALEARNSYSGMTETPIQWWHPIGFTLTLSLTSLTVSLGALKKFLAVRNGSIELIHELNGRLADCSVPEEHILIKTVEEVALATGAPMPSVVVLENENSINAFSIGDVSNGAFIGFTKGALWSLSRDEVQAVVAHLFDRITSGENILNLRLMALLHGLVGISVFGFYLCEVGAGERGLFDKEAPATVRTNPPALILGFMIAAAGFFGLVMGKLVKSLLVRGQAFSSDRFAARITGQPEALGQALKKIAARKKQGALKCSEGEVCSQFFLADASPYTLLSVFSTHPRLTRRIRRLSKSSGGTLPEPARGKRTNSLLCDSDTEWMRKIGAGIRSPAEEGEISYAQFLHHLQEPGVESLKYVRELLAQVPDNLRKRTHHPNSAIWVAYCLLLDADPEVRSQQSEKLSTRWNDTDRQAINAIYKQLSELPASTRLPLAQISAGSLRLLDKADYKVFRSNVEQLIRADSRCSIFEFLLHCLFVSSLDRQFGMENPQSAPSADELDGLMLKALASFALLTTANAEVERASAALQRALEHLRYQGDVDESAFSQCSLVTFERQLNSLSQAPRQAKCALLEGIAVCVATDGRVTRTEAEMVLAMGSIFGMPIPPFPAQ